MTKAKANALPLRIKIATIPIIGTTPLSFGRHHEEPKLNPNETPEAWEKRTFLEKIHHDEEGNVFVAPMMLSKSLAYAPAFLNLGSIPGKGNSTYTKFFLSGLSIDKPMFIGKTIKDARHESFFVSSTGQQNSGKRVVRWFGTFDEWGGTFEAMILNADIVTEEIFERVVVAAGIFTGIGRFRPANGGYYGRFRLNGAIKYTDLII